LLAGLARLVSGAQRCPVERPKQTGISKIVNFDLALGWRLLPLEFREAMETGCRRRAGEEECLEKHFVDLQKV
jgi:hypothetical protein